ncbi:MAG: methylmalonyl Co-A mutase-associated GTPase MeaB [Albidovulum sp.]|nr:methylmalonyl Co-A mutase-associated GTPase MeaB [Albidovulum sp.]
MADSIVDIERTSRLLRNGDRKSLARAITLAESARGEDRESAARLMDALHSMGSRQSLRIGLTGPPGTGKSTFVDCFGSWLTERGKKIAVLAIDPSSSRTGGSILGDKTRMEQLAQNSNAFVRPSPTRNASGGISHRTRESVYLCEQAGFDIVFIETAGVGQSETSVSEMSDIFVLLLPPAAGDELQGVKRGIMEYADLVLVTKADGDLKRAAGRTRSEYASALHFFSRKRHDPPGRPKVFEISSHQKTGLDIVWEELVALETWRKDNGAWHIVRRRQAIQWLEAAIHESLLEEILGHTEARQLLIETEQKIQRGKIMPAGAALEALRSIRSRWKPVNEY